MPGRPTCALVVLGLAFSTRGGDGFVGPTAGAKGIQDDQYMTTSKCAPEHVRTPVAAVS